jgi:hypothetical protein
MTTAPPSTTALVDCAKSTAAGLAVATELDILKSAGSDVTAQVTAQALSTITQSLSAAIAFVGSATQGTQLRQDFATLETTIKSGSDVNAIVHKTAGDSGAFIRAIFDAEAGNFGAILGRTIAIGTIDAVNDIAVAGKGIVGTYNAFLAAGVSPTTAFTDTVNTVLHGNF